MFTPMSSLADVRRVHLPAGLLPWTTAKLREFGADGNEGFLLWAGTVEAGVARIERCLVPPQNPIRSERGVGYFITGETLFAVNKFLNENRLRLIAQVHSHPTDAYHSSTDDEYAIVTTEGGFSLVVPDFGHCPAALSSWASYRLIRGAWAELGQRQVLDLFREAAPAAS